MIEIIKINPENYPNGKKVIFSYTSDKYYDILINDTEGWGIYLKLKDFEREFSKSEEIEIFDEYKKDAEVYLAYYNKSEAGLISFIYHQWNNTLRILDLYIYEDYKRKKIGKSLIDFAIQYAKDLNIRAVVLETQTCNYPAINFYLNSGFKLVGIDTINYSNDDLKNKNVRIEMAYLFK